MQLGLGFERNNVIKGRIEMIKNFKNGSYKISAKGALGCLAAAVIVCTNGITVNALDINTSSIDNISSHTDAENKHEFLIDRELKVYDDINKVKEIAGFDFKLPENILQRNKPESYQVIKVSDTSNQVVAYFDGSGERNTFSLIIFKDNDAEQGLCKYFEKRHDYNKDQIESNSELMSMGNIEGYKVNLKVTTPEDHFENYIIPECIDKYSYFVWQNDGVWYGIEYEHYYESEGETKGGLKLSNEELSDIASSLKNIDEIKNIDYLAVADKELSTELGIMSIYDKDDLQKAENMIGFNLKFPLVINNYPIQDSVVGITGDSDVENDKVYYELLNIYNKEECYVNLLQSKHDAFNRYNDAKNNGYIYLNEDKKVSTEKIDIDGNTVYRFMEKEIDEENSKENISIDYLWQKDGIYYSVSMWNVDGYHDDIAKEVIESKHIE
ncbi:MAG: hypothetical protein ACI398_09440 [Clostridium sp.]